MKSRYKALRSIGCDWLTSCFIALMNEIVGVPQGTVIFMNVIMDYDVKETK